MWAAFVGGTCRKGLDDGKRNHDGRLSAARQSAQLFSHCADKSSVDDGRYRLFSRRDDEAWRGMTAHCRD